jgi:ABC-type sugar transport system ATPase subunit
MKSEARLTSTRREVYDPAAVADRNIAMVFQNYALTRT